MSKNNIGGCKAAEKNRVQVTTKQQEKINARQAERKLHSLSNANYGYNDYRLVLHYI